MDTLSSAFQHDLALSWILPDPAQRRLRLPKLFDIVVRSDLAAGSVLRSKSCEVITLWRPPGKAHVGLIETLLSGLGYFQTFGTALGRGLAVSHAMESHHPRRIPTGALRWRLFDFGKVDAEVDSARSADAEVLASHRQSVLRAAEDSRTRSSD